MTAAPPQTLLRFERRRDTLHSTPEMGLTATPKIVSSSDTARLANPTSTKSSSPAHCKELTEKTENNVRNGASWQRSTAVTDTDGVHVDEPVAPATTHGSSRKSHPAPLRFISGRSTLARASSSISSAGVAYSSLQHDTNTVYIQPRSYSISAPHASAAAHSCPTPLTASGSQQQSDTDVAVNTGPLPSTSSSATFASHPSSSAIASPLYTTYAYAPVSASASYYAHHIPPIRRGSEYGVMQLVPTGMHFPPTPSVWQPYHQSHVPSSRSDRQPARNRQRHPRPRAHTATVAAPQVRQRSASQHTAGTSQIVDRSRRADISPRQQTATTCLLRKRTASTASLSEGYRQQEQHRKFPRMLLLDTTHEEGGVM